MIHGRATLSQVSGWADYLPTHLRKVLSPLLVHMRSFVVRLTRWLPQRWNVPLLLSLMRVGVWSSIFVFWVTEGWILGVTCRFVDDRADVTFRGWKSWEGISWIEQLFIFNLLFTMLGFLARILGSRGTHRIIPSHLLLLERGLKLCIVTFIMVCWLCPRLEERGMMCGFLAILDRWWAAHARATFKSSSNLKVTTRPSCEGIGCPLATHH